MKHSDVKMWMKVVPYDKTPDGRVKGLKNSIVWKEAQLKNQNYLYVAFKRPNDDYPECLLSLNYLDKSGDYFLSSDFKKYKK